MADLRSRFIEDYAGGLLNVSRQELASNGEVLSQDGFLTDSTIYVEDGVGTKSGLRLGVGLAEVVDPTTQTGIVNVRYADRTYTKIRDTKIFTTAMASAQAALAESVAESLGNIESAIDYLEIFDAQADTRLSALESEYTTLSGLVSQNSNNINDLRNELKDDINNTILKPFPIGGIIMWSNYDSAGIPTGWVLCDGRNGTPDLRNKFIIGAGDKYLVGQNKNEGPLSPEHKHSATFNAGLELVSGLKSNNDPNSGPADGTILANVGAFPDLEPMEAATEYGPFKYDVTVENEGSADEDKTYPPYYALAYIMRLF